MENLNELQKLVNTSANIVNAIDKYKNIYQKDTNHYDKLGFGFNLDPRFAACNGISLHVDTWKGVYGNSGSSTILDVDEKIFNTHLLKVLSNDFWNIMDKVSESIYNEAITLKQAAKNELEERLEKINKL